MMKVRINLLPPEQRPSEWNYGRLLMLPIVLVMIVIGAVYAYGEYRYWDLERQLTQTRSRYESLAAVEQQMKVAQTRQTAVQAREKVLLQVSATRNSWYGTIAHLGSFMPRKVWMTEIAAAHKDVVMMKGNAQSYPDLVEFLGKLEQDKKFADPTLLKAEQNDKELLAKFEISVKIGRQ
jgi:Tfp pilus assembly protein PilN